jgi:ketosteroid isomerase-like protein
MKTLVTILLLCSSLLLASEAEIDKAERAWADAVVKRDVATLEKTFDNNLIYAHSTGAIENKAQYFERLKSGKQRYDKITFESIKVIPHGNAAVAHSVLWMQGTSNGEPFNNHVMMMHLWVKQGNTWKIAAHQTTRLPN